MTFSGTSNASGAALSRACGAWKSPPATTSVLAVRRLHVEPPRGHARPRSGAGMVARGSVAAEPAIRVREPGRPVDIRNALAHDSLDELPARHWEEAAAALVFQVATQTGVRPPGVGPDSTETVAVVYRWLRDWRVAAQIHWHEGRSSLDDLRGACPVRTDVSPKLRCVVLAEASVLLGRRPHVEAYIGIDDAPPGVAAEAAAVLTQSDLARSGLTLLV